MNLIHFNTLATKFSTAEYARKYPKPETKASKICAIVSILNFHQTFAFNTMKVRRLRQLEYIFLNFERYLPTSKILWL